LGHFDPWAPGRVPAKGHANLLLHFGSEGGAGAAKLLGEALATARQRDAAILALCVVPASGRSGGDEAAPYDDVLLVEDPDGRWAEAFGVYDTPATVLVGPRGDIVWSDASATTSKTLANALDKHAKEGGEIATIPIRLSIGLGQRPPDVPLRLADGSELSLRRLKGRPLAIVFCTTRSEPSLTQLDVLRDVHLSRGSKGPLTIAIGDGESRERVALIAKEKDLPFLLLAEPDRRISRAFGVWCWPATVWIRPDQVVEAIDFGVTASPTPAYPS
jgi:peroxiredoxin